ncbi:Pyurf [Symbiodinium sp. KB8]|nr:Pyurf [Symbiodinium sp. KB8]
MNGSQGIGALFLEHVRASGLVPLARLPEKLTRCGLSLVGDNMSPLSRVRSSIMRCMHGTAKRGLASSSRNRHQPAAFHLLVCPITKGPLEYDSSTNELVSVDVRVAFPVQDGVPNLVPSDARRIPPAETQVKHKDSA